MKILVLEALGLQAGYLGCYGNDWVATPNLDRLASEAIVFDAHIIADPVEATLTERSTGNGRYRWPDADDNPLAADATVVLPGGIACRYQSMRSFEAFEVVLDSILAWRKSEEPVLWIAGPDLAPPWDLPEDILELYADDDPEIEPDDLQLEQDRYAAVVTYWDAVLGKLLDSLRAAGILDETVVWVTSNRGWPIGAEGASRLRDEVVLVPLLWRLPHGTEGGRRVLGLTQSVDLLPSLGEFLGIPVPPDCQGRSLRPLAMGQADQVRPYACAALREGEAEEWLLRAPSWALHLPVAAPPGEILPPARLYVKPDDRWEVNDVSARQPDVSDRLERTLRAFATEVVKPGPLVYPPLDDPPST